MQPCHCSGVKPMLYHCFPFKTAIWSYSPFQRRPNGLYLPSNIGVNPASGKAMGYSVDIPVYPINIPIYLYSHTCWWHSLLIIFPTCDV
jgi:hypothetical protein